MDKQLPGERFATVEGSSFSSASFDTVWSPQWREAATAVGDGGRFEGDIWAASHILLSARRSLPLVCICICSSSWIFDI